jgi:Vitamin B6 photo-protection and homoeostasis
VSGGATRTAITQHQARANNISDVAAKDGSQETMVTNVKSPIGPNFTGLPTLAKLQHYYQSLLLIDFPFLK